MGVLDTLMGRNDGKSDELIRERWENARLEENLQKLELTLAGDGDWRRMGAELEHDFTRGGLDDLMDISRAMYLSNPLIQRAVNVRAYYTWGQGMTFSAEESRMQELIDEQTADELNRIELYGHQARILTDCDQSIDGNIFMGLVTNDFGDVNVRSIPANEIRDIITKPGDRRTVMYYRRQWTESEFNEEAGTHRYVEKEAYYPDIHWRPRGQRSQIGTAPVMWHIPVIHQRTGGTKQMKFGIPETYAALDWARAYKNFLEDWHSIVSSLARFAWRLSVKGTKLEASKRRIDSTLSGNNPVEGNKPPAAGSVFLSSGDDELQAIPKVGTNTSADDARPSRLMVGSAMDLPDTILSGDAATGNLATAKTLDRPTELAIRSRQFLWSEFHQAVFRYSAEAKVLRRRLPGKVIPTPDGLIIEPSFDTEIKCQFPPILEHDIVNTVTGIVAAATLSGKTDAGTMPREELSELLMHAVGVENVEAAMEALAEQHEEDEAKAEEIARAES